MGNKSFLPGKEEPGRRKEKRHLNMKKGTKKNKTGKGYPY